MGVRMTGLSSGIDPKTIESLVEAQKIPLETARKRRDKVVGTKKEFESFDKTLTGLDAALTKLKTKADFYRLKVESSHPDIMDGVVQSDALPGSYEFEVRGLARSAKELAYGFPDKDQTSVGFGYMLVHRLDQEPLEVVVEPGSTLQDVAQQINDASAGMRAMVINTKHGVDSYRLLVVSEESGQEARIEIDPDTTYMEFKNQVAGSNLDVLFEDVPVTDVKNQLDELVEGVVFNVKRSEPGTRVQVNITHDVDATVEGIKGFVDGYNAIAQFAYDQSKYNEDTKQAGPLGGDGSLRGTMRQLQMKFQEITSSSGKFSTLADIGITTDPKSGALKMDDAKVKQALTEDYDSVARLFIRSTTGDGIAHRLSEAVKAVRDPAGGVLKSRIRGIESIIKNQDKDIEKRERQFEQQEAMIRRKFQALEGQMANLQAQGSYLGAKLGGGTPTGGGGGQQGG